MKILYVDDDNINQEMITLMLFQRGFEIETASNGQEAVEAVRNGTYDLVLMDVQMPVMDGIEATKIIRSWEDGNHNTPIIALTANDMVSSIHECVQAGMNDFVSKPFSVQQLLNVINSILKDDAVALDVNKVQHTSISEQKMVTLDTETGLMNCNNDIILYKKFLREFVNALPEKTDKIYKNLSSGNTGYALRLVHNLKGVSATLGAMKFSHAAAQLEHSIEPDGVAIIELSLKYFRDQTTELQIHIDKYLDGI